MRSLTSTIIAVHGAFCAGWAFDRFRAPIEARGFRFIAPDLPGHGGHEGRSAVTGASMRHYTTAIRRLIQAQPAPPILIGHSLGGLVAQMAAARSKVAGLILLAPSSPWGVVGTTAEEAISTVTLYALGPYWAMAVDPDYASAHRYLFDRLPGPERRETFARLVPESGRALWETLNWWLDPFATTTVRAGAVAAPVLALVGGRDAIHPPATVKSVASRLGGETRVFPDMSHWLVGEPGWEEVAETCVDWIEDLVCQRPLESASRARP
jgi:pimeloyl-ACP methyl ester carboxylesterase